MDDAFTESPSGETPQDPSADIRTLTRYMELLSVLSRRPLEHWMPAAWQTKVGNIEAAVERLVSEGLLREATPSEKLNHKFRVPELKQFLSARSVRASGNKSALVESLLSVMTPVEVQTLVVDVRLYRATEEGIANLQQHGVRIAKMTATMEADALQLLLAGNVGGAVSRIAAHRQALGNPAPVSDVNRNAAHYILKLNFTDLPLDTARRNEVAGTLALAELLGDSYLGAVARLEHFWDMGLHLPDISSFLGADSAHTHLESYDGQNAKDVFELYLMTRMYEAHATADLGSLLLERSQCASKGVSIVRSDDDACTQCRSTARKYRWSELERLPKLPNHWGCLCWYSEWFD